MIIINRSIQLILLLLCSVLIVPTGTKTTEAPKTTTEDISLLIYDDYSDDGMGSSSSAQHIADQIAFGVISCVSVGVLIIMAYMAIFGQRIRATAAKWHVINTSLWGILHLVSYASFAEKAPWPNYITNKDWRDTSKQVECITRSVFPAGMIFVYLEMIILTIVPKAAGNILFNMIFFALLIPFLNGLMIFCYFAHYMDVDWFYEPSDLFNLATYVIFVVFTIIYLIWCLFGTCMCCFSIASKKETARSMATYADMWLLFPYGLIPSIMYGPSFGMTSVGFAMKHLLSWVLKSGLLGGGMPSSDAIGLIDMNLIIQVMTNAILAMPWFVLLFPLVQSVLTLVCIRMFREQFFFTLSCGRVYEGTKYKVGSSKINEDWVANTIGIEPPNPENAEQK